MFNTLNEFLEQHFGLVLLLTVLLKRDEDIMKQTFKNEQLFGTFTWLLQVVRGHLLFQKI